MPLSDHEQRILADIEARLRADDPQLADTVGTTTIAHHLRTRLKWSIAGFFVGFVLLFVGLAVHLVWGVVGFGIMLASAYTGLTMAKRLAGMHDGGNGPARGPLQRYLDGARRRDDDA